MADIALVPIASGFDTSFDLALTPTDLSTDGGLKTAVIVSLFSDRQAEPDDPLPDNSGDLRGWWGDLPIDGASDKSRPDHIGSRLWLLDRAAATPQNAVLAQNYCEEALAWLIEDGIAKTVIVSAAWIGPGALEIVISIARLASPGKPDPRFDFVWNTTLAN